MTRLIVLVGFVLLLVGCPPKQERVPPTRSGEVEVASADEIGPQGRPWRRSDRGAISDAVTGLVLELPERWEVRRGSGDAVWEARAPGGRGPSVTLGRWGGSVDGLAETFDAAQEGWLSSGPYGDLEVIADGAPLVSTREGAEGSLVFGWYVSIGGSGVAIEATVPAVGFEAAWREVDAIVRSSELEERR